ncbi:hypothetical protein SNOG_09765 [Parastagonospora nodorum SN15]|uniref:Uncharacterized protein n=1 Tax=Phaeosphaeria nodorum (strain SN15 / ATCC MYA-4574 / FGSC 10173) TaxID=321614 RepID=Q0UEP9_PHANO|nr:hypothetical protein SNOG_09765 [Parastagonospora nodorum SN15]EAT83030.1 hypothetical protein SNOG_09765 [Parastagonospora nodorum SN15]
MLVKESTKVAHQEDELKEKEQALAERQNKTRTARATRP